jgi:ankyrin repeat protein
MPIVFLQTTHSLGSLANEHGNTALHYACFFNHKNIATLIAERFYLTIAIPNKYDKTCLSFADDEMIAKLKDSNPF